MDGTPVLRHRLAQHDALSDSSTEDSLEELDGQELLLRDLPCSMKEKRLLRQLRASTGRDVSYWVVWRQRQSRAQNQFQEGIWNLVRIFQLWKPPLDEIGGNFGPGIQSYFTFLRFLLFINFLAVLLATGFILLPVIISQNTTIFPTGLSADPECIKYSSNVSYRSAWQRFQDIFTGEGSLEYSYLFYGAYHVTQDSKNHYNVHLAYLLSILGYFFACLIWILRRIVASMARWQMLRWEFKPCVSARIFTEWDFCIQSPEAATLKQRNIYNHLKIDLAEQIRHLQNQQRTRKQLAKLYLLRLLINGVILLLTGAAFYCIYAATEFSQGHSQKNAASLDVLSQYLPPVAISIVNVILPLLFHVLTQLEGYSPNTEVNLTLVRCVILKLSSLGMFMFFLGRRVLCIGSGGAPQCHQCGYNKLYQCWETHIGQEMYKMTLFSFLTTLGSAFLISLPRRLIAKHSSCGLAQWLGKEEFLVPHNVLDIVAAQTVIWTGIFFCPLLPLLACVFVFFTFYIKKYTLFQNCQPSTQLFRASHSKFLFQIMLLLGLFQAYVPLGYVISRVSPSQACGLFTNYSTPWEAVPKALSRLPMSTQRALSYATSNVFCFLLLMVLSLILTVYVSQVQANRHIIERLKRQRVQCVKEKWCLVRKLAQRLVKQL
ncbi:transmembrane channel-like protein 8 [Podarcis raffonei]|uniref:transmembrane channel-like protein 8 n=1 Tax=Podarcis raffonei TaxID=65483 RepID=UPI00232948E6|nr:transmembrane channel-like protein 8 [Podarcis raffonei]XP_053231585.1 transmembrane channel-like protein 8 [Podarcis raffonei]